MKVRSTCSPREAFHSLSRKAFCRDKQTPPERNSFFLEFNLLKSLIFKGLRCRPAIIAYSPLWRAAPIELHRGKEGQTGLVLCKCYGALISLNGDMNRSLLGNAIIIRAQLPEAA